MTTCYIPGCDNKLTPHARLKTCAACRQALHNLERKSPAQILDRSSKLRKYAARTEVIATIDSDGKVQKVGHDELEAEELLMFPKRRAKKSARSNIVEFRRRRKA